MSLPIDSGTTQIDTINVYPIVLETPILTTFFFRNNKFNFRLEEITMKFSLKLMLKRWKRDVLYFK